MATIVVSVPHSLCRDENDKEEHVCDVGAERVARKVFDVLTDRGHKVLLRIADENRIEVDYNRPEGRDSKWRKDLAKDLNKAQYLIDVHSYPNEMFGNWNNDLVLLKMTDEQDNREEVYRVLSILAQADLDVAVTDAAKENDIVKEALENGVPAILFEFKEDAGPGEIATRFANAMADYFDSMSNDLSEKSIHDLIRRL